MNNKNNASSGGLGLSSVLTIVFVVLKLVGVIDWKWIWVLCPLWIDLILTVLVIIGVAIIWYMMIRSGKKTAEYAHAERRRTNGSFNKKVAELSTDS